MAYQRQHFTDFDESNPLCARHLNHIEDGIATLEAELENGGGGGGSGEPGFSPIAMVEQIDNGAKITITDTNGTTTATVENGTDGYSPVRGTDYWTAADIAEIKSYVDEAILGGEW